MNLVSEKLMDLGNLTIAGMVISQLIPQAAFSGRALFGGIIGGTLAYGGAYLLLRRAQQ